MLNGCEEFLSRTYTEAPFILLNTNISSEDSKAESIFDDRYEFLDPSFGPQLKIGDQNVAFYDAFRKFYGEKIESAYSLTTNSLAEPVSAPVLSANMDGQAGADRHIETATVSRASQNYIGTALRDLTSEGELVQTMVEKILSIALTKKVVLAFDPKLGGMHSAKIRAVFEVIEELKKDPKFEKFLRTRNIEVLSKLTDVDKFAGIDTAEVFVFTGDITGIPVAENVHTAIVNEKDFPTDAYYPLAEIVAISLSNFLDSSTLSKAMLIARKINIDSIVESDGRLVFTLLPSAKEHELQELVRHYARLKDLLRNA